MGEFQLLIPKNQITGAELGRLFDQGVLIPYPMNTALPVPKPGFSFTKTHFILISMALSVPNFIGFLDFMGVGDDETSKFEHTGDTSLKARELPHEWHIKLSCKNPSSGKSEEKQIVFQAIRWSDTAKSSFIFPSTTLPRLIDFLKSFL